MSHPPGQSAWVEGKRPRTGIDVVEPDPDWPWAFGQLEDRSVAPTALRWPGVRNPMGGRVFGQNTKNFLWTGESRVTTMGNRHSPAKHRLPEWHRDHHSCPGAHGGARGRR